MMDDEYFRGHCDAWLFEAMMHAGFNFPIRNSDLSPIRRRSSSPAESRRGEIRLLPKDRFNVSTKYSEYSEIAQKNAEELIKEEEQARIKAEKKKAKKERQKMKKQQDKAINIDDYNMKSDNLTNTISSDVVTLNIASDNKESEVLDENAAFVSKAAKKVQNNPIIKEETNRKKEVKDIIYFINKAQEYENGQNYKEAVQYLSDAINLKPKSIDLILKRSFCYFELAKFEKSIRDAKKVIGYSPNNPHAYYRLGEAQFALANWSAAEAAFTKLLSINSYCEEAKNRLFSIRIKQLEGMGYHPNEAFTALRSSKNKTLDEAIDFLNELEEGKHREDLYYSDEDDEDDDYKGDDEDDDYKEDDDDESSEGASGPHSISSDNNLKIPYQINNKSPLFTDPKNPVGCPSLFVGNLKKGVEYREIHDVFSKFGEIITIKLSTEQNCYAFVNYVAAESAGEAMAAMQGSRRLLSTVPLLIKYPVNVVRSLLPTLKNKDLILRMLAAPTSSNKSTPTRAASVPPHITSRGKVKTPALKNSVPVVKKPVAGVPRPAPKTEVCFYWRTSGCGYGNKCFNLHIPQNKGIDMIVKKPCH